MTHDLVDTLRGLGLPLPRGVLQVGASFGQEVNWFVDNGIRAGVVIEPLAQPYQALSQQCMQRPHFVVVSALCADEDGQHVRFHVASNGGMSSSMLAPASHLKEFDVVRFEQTVEMMSHRLDHIVGLLEQNGHAEACGVLDLLYMDTQGAGMKVLRGAGTVLERVNVILTEVARNRMYDVAPDLAVLIADLAPRGFTLNNVNFDRHHHGDALFVHAAALGMH